MYPGRTQQTDKDGKRYEFLGLFCANRLPAGAFIGLYRGEWSYKQAPKRGADKYGLQLSMGARVDTPLLGAEDEVRLDYKESMIALANEPGPRGMANAYMAEWTLDADQVEDPTGDPIYRYHCIGLVAGAAIEAGTEICWHYGDAYDRTDAGYEGHGEVGAKCQHTGRPPPSPVSDWGLGADARLPVGSYTCMLFTPEPSDCDSDDGDEDYCPGGRRGARSRSRDRGGARSRSRGRGGARSRDSGSGQDAALDRAQRLRDLRAT